MGGKVATRKAKKPNPYTTKLDKLDKRLASTTDGDALGALALEFHSVGYSLGHDISAIIDDPGLVDRAKAGEVDARERAAAAFESAGNIRHALHHLFEGLDAFPERADRERLVASIVTILDAHGAPQMGTELAALPVIADEEKARDQFYDVVRRIKTTIDWDRLSRGA